MILCIILFENDINLIYSKANFIKKYQIKSNITPKDMQKYEIAFVHLQSESINCQQIIRQLRKKSNSHRKQTIRKAKEKKELSP